MGPDVGVLPELTLEALAEDRPGAIKIGPFGSALRKEEMVPVGRKVYGQENVIAEDWALGERRISEAKFQSLASCRLEPGDVVLTMMGTIGKCLIFPASAECGLMDSHLLRIQPNLTLVDRAYLQTVLQADRIVGRQVRRLSHGSIMAGLSSGIVRRLLVPLPPLPEQRRIAEILDTLDAAIRKTEQIIAKLKQVKEGLLHDLLTRGIDENGELRDPGRHPEQFMETVLGRMPRNWARGVWGDFIDDIRYGTSQPSEAGPSGVPVLRIPNVQDGRIDLADLKYQFPSKADLERFTVSPGDLLVIRTNGNPRLLGRCAEVPSGVARFLFASYLIRIRLSRAGLAPGFAATLMNSSGARDYIESRAATSAGNYNINTAQLRAMPICVPPPQEQARIVAVLEEAGQRLAMERATAEKCRSLRGALLDDLLTGRVRVTNLLRETAA